MFIVLNLDTDFVVIGFQIRSLDFVDFQPNFSTLVRVGSVKLLLYTESMLKVCRCHCYKNWQSSRVFGTFSPTAIRSAPVDEQTTGGRNIKPDLAKFMHGRGNRERRDSVTNAILKERQLHLERLSRLPVDASLVKTLDQEGLGTRKRKHMVYAPINSAAARESNGVRRTNSGAGSLHSRCLCCPLIAYTYSTVN